MAESHSTRYALIAGAAEGIGRALVEKLNKTGCAVIATHSKTASAGLACTHYLQGDLEQVVRDESRAQHVLHQMPRALGAARLNAPVNNPATRILGRADDRTRRDWQHTLDVNLLAPFLLA